MRVCAWVIGWPVEETLWPVAGRKWPAPPVLWPGPSSQRRKQFVSTPVTFSCAAVTLPPTPPRNNIRIIISIINTYVYLYYILNSIYAI